MRKIHHGDFPRLEIAVVKYFSHQFDPFNETSGYNRNIHHGDLPSLEIAVLKYFSHQLHQRNIWLYAENTPLRSPCLEIVAVKYFSPSG